MRKLGDWNRNSRRLIAVEGLQFLVPFALLVVALSFWGSHGSEVAPTLLAVAGFLYAPLRIAWIVGHWFSEKYRLDSDLLIMRTGVFRRQSRHLAWESVVAIDEQAGLFFRAFGLRRLQLTQSDSIGGSVVFRGIRPEEVQAIRQLVSSRHEPREASRADGNTDLIYTVNWRELALMSIVNGRFALLAPPALFAAWGLLEQLGVSTWLLELLEQIPVPALVVGSVLGFVLLGALATIAKYQGFSARLLPSQSLVLSYGFVEKRERHIDLHSIEGITIKRSLIEQVLHRSRLAVLTFRGSDDVGASVVLPSLPDRIVRRIARSHFQEFVLTSPILVDQPAPVLRNLFGFGLIFAIPAAIVLVTLDAGVEIAWALSAGLVALTATTGIGRLLVSRVEVGTQGILTVRRRLVSERDIYVRASSCHWVGSTHLRNASRPILISLHLYAGGARMFTSMRCSAESCERLREVTATALEPVSLRQKAMTHTGPSSG